MRRPVVDPRFGATLRRLREQRGLSLRELGRLATYSPTYLWELETDRKPPSVAVGARLDRALKASGELAILVADAATPLTPDDEERLAAIARNPRRVDPAAVDALTGLLAHQRRFEDAVGATPLVTPVAAQLAVVEDLTAEARGQLRAEVVDMAAQWAQFAGWLSASAGDPDTARRWYARALEWAAEVGNTDMISTLLNLRGHLEWQAGRVGPMIGLSAAAQQQAATPGVKALAAQQEARGHALTGDTEAAERKLAEAVALTEAAAANPDGSPPWVYFHSSEYLTLQRGLAYHLLGDEEAAVELLTAGLAALPASVRRTEWTAWYVYRLALAHSRLGNRDRAEAALAEVAGMAEQTGSVRLRAAAERLARHLGL